MHEPEADAASGGAGTLRGVTSSGGALAPGGADNSAVSETMSLRLSVHVKIQVHIAMGIQELGSFMCLTIEQATNLHVPIHEGNVGALTLGNLEPRRGQNYAVKYHWFRTHLKPRNIILDKDCNQRSAR